jgi:hypothetical protein
MPQIKKGGFIMKQIHDVTDLNIHNDNKGAPATGILGTTLGGIALANQLGIFGGEGIFGGRRGGREGGGGENGEHGLGWKTAIELAKLQQKVADDDTIDKLRFEIAEKNAIIADGVVLGYAKEVNCKVEALEAQVKFLQKCISVTPELVTTAISVAG